MDQFTDAIAIYFILQFCWSYYRTCYRKGYKLDFWHITLVQILFTIHVMLPFIRSPFNILTIGPVLFGRTLPWIDRAYLISAFGYAFLLLGGQLWRVNLRSGFRRSSSAVLMQIARPAIMFIESPRLIMLAGTGTVVMMIAVLGYYFKVAGFGFNLRGQELVRPELRAVGNLSAFLAFQIGSFALARFVVYRERRMLLLFVSLAGMSLFYGSRSILLEMVMTVVVIWLIRLRMRLHFGKLLLAILAAFTFSFSLSAARAGHFSLMAVIFDLGRNIFYGNSYSDTRDFATILSAWDGHFFYGLTYLAGLFAFVPRFVSSFRNTYAVGVVTATIAGFNPTQHPGLRIGEFGEAYLNFGLPGVAVVGLIVGYVFRWMDLTIKAALDRRDRPLVVYCITTAGLVLGAIVNSSTASTMYSVFLLYLVLWVMIGISRAIRLPLA